MNRIGFLLFGCLMFALGLSAQSRADEFQPEFEGLTEAEEEKFDGPNRLGSEYQSDILTYGKPEIWEYHWLANPLALDFSAGSVSAAHFRMDNRAKFRRDLVEDRIEFRFTFNDERDRERESVHHFFELAFWPLRFIGLSLYTEPSLYKREDDTGAAILMKLNRNSELRIWNTFVDVTRLRRNDRKDTFDPDFTPSSRGVVARIWSPSEGPDREFFEMAYRDESETHWIFPVEEYEYRYAKRLFWLYGLKSLGDRVGLGFRLQRDWKTESKMTTLGAGVMSESDACEIERWFATLRLTIQRIDIQEADRFFGALSNWEVSGGIQVAERWWLSARGVTPFKYHDLLPHFWLSVPGVLRGGSHDRFRVGYEMTWHRAVGSTAYWGPDERAVALEHRLNLSYDLIFGDYAEIKIIATGDLDEFGTRESWEGGNVQFRAHF